MKKIEVGIVGLGRQAMRHLQALSTFDDVEISAVCDVNENAVKRVSNIYRISSHYNNYLDMAEKSSVECVWIITKPDETHAKIASAFLENGKHVFCEKPMATSISQAEDIVRKAKRNGRILMIGFNRRFMPIFQWAKHEFENPNQIDICIAEMCGEQTIFRGLNTNYVHIIDILRFFCGEPIKVQAESRYSDPNYEEMVAAFIKFNSGAIGFHISSSKTGGYIEHVKIYGSHKTIEVDVPSLTFKSLKGGAYQPAIVTRIIAESWKDLSYKFGFEQEDRHFIECIKNGETPLTSGEDSLKTLLLVDSIYRQCGLPPL